MYHDEPHEGYPERDGNSAEAVCDATDKEDDSEAALDDTLLIESLLSD